MSAPRFFFPHPLRGMDQCALPPEQAHHALRVLRLETGAAVVLFDGLGGEYPGVLRIQKQAAWVQLGAHNPVERELAGQLVLMQGLATGDKMDWIVEKAVELGVSAVQPIIAERSVLRLSGERLARRLARWEGIVQAASEQCGRNRLMRVHAPQTLAHCLAALDAPGLFFHPEATRTLPEALQEVGPRLHLLVGPEGGWSDREQACAQDHCLQPVSFGPRILRTETAGLALTAATAACLGW